MLIRVRGGRAGIAQYLRGGQKAGREQSRDELDQRLVLSGNLSATDLLIRSMDSEGERYLHVTLSFKEDNLLPELMRTITERFRTFALAAYAEDEYCYYAEAHLPRIKSYVNRATGDFVERKPHIHVVIPTINLLSGRRLDPFGLVKQAEIYYDAFQEAINCEFGLASPKDAARVQLGGGSIAISRLKGDEFTGSVGRQSKSSILQKILDHDICDWASFLRLLGAMGEVKVRKADSTKPYAHLVPEGKTRGINLREHVFSPEFLQLPRAEKLQRIHAKSTIGYVEKTSGRRLSPEHESRLWAWRTWRSHEVRWLNPGNRKLWRAYKCADQGEKARILEERRQEWEQKYRKGAQDRTAPVEKALAAPGLIDARNSKKPATDRSPKTTPVAVETPRARPWSDSRIGELAREQAYRVQSEAAALEDEVPSLEDARKYLDGQRLLAALATSHGVLIAKYAAIVDAAAVPRIQCGNRKLTLADFLTKEIHLDWKSARVLLLATYTEQLREQLRDQSTTTSRLPAPITNPLIPKVPNAGQGLSPAAGLVTDLKGPDAFSRPLRAVDLAVSDEQVHAGSQRTDERQRVKPLDAEILVGTVKRPIRLRRATPTSEIGIPGMRPETETRPTLPSKPHVQDTSPSDRVPVARLFAIATSVLATAERRACAYDEGGNPTVFFDGSSISSDRWEDDAVLQTMIEIAHELFGSELSVEGTIEFKEAVGRMAAELGLDIQFGDALAAECYESRRTELAASNAPGM